MSDEEPVTTEDPAPEEPAQDDKDDSLKNLTSAARLEKIDHRTPMEKVLHAIPRNKEDTHDIFWSDILTFYQIFGKTLEGDELAAFQKKYNPENKMSLPQDRGLPAFTEFISKDEFILMLQSESKVLDPKNGGTVHHAEDFRMMLKELGDDIGDDLVNDFIREALGKGDDEFDINVYLQFMCQETKFTEEVKKSKVGR